MYTIVKCSVKKYDVFRPLCCVDTAVNFAGKFYCIEPDIAFVAYTRPFWNNGMRGRIWPEYVVGNGQLDLTWLNRNIRSLARIMVAKEHRGRGIARYLLEHTIDMAGVPFVECVTFTDSIARLLEKVGFINYGRMVSGKCDYWLYSVKNPVTWAGRSL